MDADALVNYCIVSDEYWPSLHVDSTITHHTRAARLQSRFSDTFDDIKKPKKLEIAPQLGQVFLDLDFDDGTTREFSVSPTQVSSCVNAYNPIHPQMMLMIDTIIQYV